MGYKISLSVLIIVGLMAFFAPIISSDAPSLFRLVPFGPTSMDHTIEIPQSPGWNASKHYLGTDHLGRDVLAGLIHGAKISLSVGILAAVSGSIIGLILGIFSGFMGEDGLKINGLSLLFVFFFIISLFYFIYLQSAHPELNTTLKLLFLALPLLGIYISQHFFKHIKSYAFPLDSIIMRCTDLFSSIPSIFLIILLSLLIKPSVGSLIALIAISSWMPTARITRGETLRIKQMAFIEYAKSIGQNGFGLLLRQILPNLISPVMIHFVFSISSAILAESALSFLGLGVPAETASWGAMMASGRDHLDLWWLSVFPGIGISLTLLLFQHLGRQLT